MTQDSHMPIISRNIPNSYVWLSPTERWDTSWVVYGSRKRFVGEVIGQRAPWLFMAEQAMASTGVS